MLISSCSSSSRSQRVGFMFFPEPNIHIKFWRPLARFSSPPLLRFRTFRAVAANFKCSHFWLSLYCSLTLEATFNARHGSNRLAVLLITHLIIKRTDYIWHKGIFVKSFSRAWNRRQKLVSFGSNEKTTEIFTCFYTRRILLQHLQGIQLFSVIRWTI